MKTVITAVAFAAVSLCAGSAMAQSRAAASHTPAPPRLSGGDFANIDSSNRDHIDQDAESRVRGGGGSQGNTGSAPVNGIGGTGGGRYTFPNTGGRASVETAVPPDAPTGGAPAFPTNLGASPVNGMGGTGGGRLATGDGGTAPGPAEAPVNTTRSNIKRPSALAEGAAPATPVPATPIPPR